MGDLVQVTYPSSATSINGKIIMKDKQVCEDESFLEIYFPG